MTEEQAIYKVYMVESGVSFDGTWDSVALGEAEKAVGGKVLMCTFPGLSEIIWKEGDISHVSLVKASVTLEGTLHIGVSEQFGELEVEGEKKRLRPRKGRRGGSG